MFKFKSKLGFIILTIILSTLVFTGVLMAGENFIWQVEDIESDVYLMGSIHYLTEDYYPLSEPIDTAFTDSDYLAVEANVLAVDEAEIQEIVFSNAFYPAGESLEDNVDPELIERAKTRLQRYDVTESEILQMRPWYLGMWIADFRLQEMGYSPEHGVDLHFLQRADSEDIEILELESIVKQLELLSSFGPEVQELALKAELEETIQMSAQGEIEELISAWSTGDREQMRELLFQVRHENPELEDYYVQLFDQRDIEMTDKIEDYIAEERDVFVVVGAGHLAGENGILNLLEERGYELRQK